MEEGKMRVKTTKPIQFKYRGMPLTLPQGCELTIHALEEGSDEPNNYYFRYEDQHYEISDEDYVRLG